MGCVLYYVLSRGRHPFGSSLRRQGNIEAGESVLSDLTGEDRETARHLIELMICNNYMFRSVSVTGCMYVTVKSYTCAQVKAIVHIGL